METQGPARGIGDRTRAARPAREVQPPGAVWYPDLDHDAEGRGEYLDAVFAATHRDGTGGDCDRDTGAAFAANCYTATYLDLPCCGHGNDCGDCNDGAAGTTTSD